MGYMDERKNLKISEETYDRLEMAKPAGVTWDKHLTDLVKKAESWEDFHLGAFARRIESIEDELHERELVDLCEETTDLRIDLVEYGLDQEFKDD